MSKNTKYYLKCRKCGHSLDSLSDWFSASQQCPNCGHKWVDVKYYKNIGELKSLLFDGSKKPENLFHYFDFLPVLNRENIVSVGEGVIPVDRWEFLEKFAKEKYNIQCQVLAYRNDLNQGTSTFKDVAGAMAATVLKEFGIKNYVVASTGNIANAFAYYLAKADINLSVFIPAEALKANEAEAGSYGQRVFRVQGDYAYAKKIAAGYAQKNGFLMSGGNIDPMRVEGKKTMVFEWLRLLGDLPSVYIQALSGGTGPIAIEKAISDLEETSWVKTKPRHILVQPSKCAPMTHAWVKAKSENFPDGWENSYPVYDSPDTAVPTLATGNPATYPMVAPIVKKSGGEIIEFEEDKMIQVARLVSFETLINIGPASAIAVGGFFQSLKQGLIHQGDRVLINIGEGVRRAPEFMDALIYTTQEVRSVEDCTPPSREMFREKVWNDIL